jgi:hypothetical protein
MRIFPSIQRTNPWIQNARTSGLDLKIQQSKISDMLDPRSLRSEIIVVEGKNINHVTTIANNSFSECEIR